MVSKKSRQPGNANLTSGISISGTNVSIRTVAGRDANVAEHGDVIRGDKTISVAALDREFKPVGDAINAAPLKDRAKARAKLGAIKREATKGKKARVDVMTSLAVSLSKAVPEAAGALASVFGSPALGKIVGSAAKAAVSKLYRK